MEKQEIAFDPHQHIAAPEAENIIHPEKFVGLQEIVDQEQAEMLADSIAQQLRPFEQQLADVKIMLVEAKNTPEEAEILQWMEQIKKDMQAIIDKEYAGVARYANIIASGKYYSQLAGDMHRIDEATTRRRGGFTKAEEAMIEAYDRKAKETVLGLLREASQHQRRILQFMTEQGFGLPKPEIDIDQGGREALGEIFTRALGKEDRHRLSNFSTMTDEEIFHRFKKNFSECLKDSDYFSPQEKSQLENYLDSGDVKNTLALIRAFGINIKDYNYSGSTWGEKNYITGEQSSPRALYDAPTMNINYDAKTLRERFKDETGGGFIIPELPEEVRIDGVPIEFIAGVDLAVVLQKAQEFAILLNDDPDLALAKLARGDFGYAVKHLNMGYIVGFDPSHPDAISPSNRFLRGRYS